MPPPTSLQLALWCLGAFLCGSIPFGLLVVKVLGKGDVRTQGSGNIGATNVSRVAGKGVGMVVLLLDAAKGFAPTWCFSRIWPESKVGIALVALAAVLGHMFSPWLKFRGGKGVATALGVCLATAWWLPMPGFALFLLALGLTRYVSLGSVLAALSLPFTTWWLVQPATGGNHLYVLPWALLAVLVILKHRENIGRLLRGTEAKLWGSKVSSPQDGFNA